MDMRKTAALLLVVALPVALLAWLPYKGGLGSAPKALYLHWFEPTFSSKTIKAKRILSTRVFPGKKFNVSLNSTISLEGTIDLKQGEYHANLRSRFRTTAEFFSGTMHLEKPFSADSALFSSILYVTYCVLSTDPVGEKFLRQQAWVDLTELPSDLLGSP